MGKIQVSLRKKGRTKWTDLGQALDFHNTFVLKKERGESGLRGGWRHAAPPACTVGLWSHLSKQAEKEEENTDRSCIFYDTKSFERTAVLPFFRPVFLAAPHYCDGVLVSKTEVNHNTLIFRVKLPPGTIRHVPVGRHVYLKALVEGEQPGRRLQDPAAAVSPL